MDRSRHLDSEGVPVTPSFVEAPQPAPRLRTLPITLGEARRFVAENHRHNLAPQGGLFAVAAGAGSEVVGVAIAGRPVARALDDGRTVEVVRCCTTGHRNACSMLYGAITRAAKALGYHRAVTYTLAEEPGSSLKASGWTRDADLPARPSWSNPSRPRYDTDLFGTERRPTGPKVRWTKALAVAPLPAQEASDEA